MAVNPLDFSPFAWYRAAESGMVGGVFVATDLSGNGRHATQATASKQPQRVHRPDGIYSYSWQFDGVDDFLLAHNDVAAYQHAQTIIALAKLTGSSTTRRVWGFGALYSLFANGSQWGYYARSTDTIQNLGGNTSQWTVVAVRQYRTGTDVYMPSTLSVQAFGYPEYNRTLTRTSETSDGYPVYRSDTFELHGYSGAYVLYRDGSWKLEWNDTMQQTHDRFTMTYLLGASYSRAYPSGEQPLLIDVLAPESEGARAVIDGNAVASAWTPKDVMSAPPTLTIGAEGYLGWQAFPGLIAEVQVFNNYLELAEVQAIYNDYFVPRYFVEPIGGGHCAGRLGICGLMI